MKINSLKIVSFIVIMILAPFGATLASENPQPQKPTQKNEKTVSKSVEKQQKLLKPIIFTTPIESKGKIHKNFDGDSGYLSIGYRLLIVDCSETHYNPRADHQAKLYNMTLEEVYADGKKAADYVRRRLKENNNVRLVAKGIDKYGRFLVEIFFEGCEKSLNQELLDNGICQPYISREISK